MHTLCLSLALMIPAQVEPLKPGTQRRSMEIDKQKRTYLLHIPAKYDAKKPTPVVIAYHGYSMTADMMTWFTGLTEKANEAGFLLVYPNGTGALQAWNAGGFPGKLSKKQVDDVGFTVKLLDDLEGIVKVDKKRIYATGMSNGGMMCYRLAAELSDRIAAIAPVAGTMAIDDPKPKRPVPILHFHGTADTFVPFDGIGIKKANLIKVLGVDATMKAWVKLNKCSSEPIIAHVPGKKNQMHITQKYYQPEEGGAEVMIYIIDKAGHTWPGGPANGGFIGPCTYDINATDLMWNFFQRQRLP